MSVKKHLKVLVLFDTAGTPPADQNFSEEFKTESWKTEAQVVRDLKSLGHDVHMLGIYEEVGLFYETVRKIQPDIIFNLMEHFGGYRRLDRAVVGLFEMMRVPYTGCGSLGLALCRHKELSKHLMTSHRIKNPEFMMVRKGEHFKTPPNLKLPCIVKMASEDASEGISQASLVETEDALIERIRFVHEHLNNDALVERFIPGRELYVSAIGDKRVEVLPVREMIFKKMEDAGNAIATYKTKWDDGYRKRWGIENVFSELAPDIQEKIIRLSKRIYKILRIDGYARIDFRLTPQGEVIFIEANPNPYLAEDEDFAQSAKKAGYDFPELLQAIINLGLRRIE